MKKYFLAAFFLVMFSLFSHAQTKRALIIAIGNYPDPEKNGWRQINSLHDVDLIRNALLKQGFPAANIAVITDEQATKAGIIRALDSLIQVSKPGDAVVIHVSSHGEQIEDDNVNEEVDGLDECIVPYGAVYSPDRSVFNKLSEGYLRDDTFGEKITLLRNKLGKNGDVLVDLDACHSGSGTRGAVTPALGNNSPMVSNNFDQKKIGLKDTAGVFMESNNTKLSKDAATYVVISGAQAQELNYECFDDSNNLVGSLSYAFSKAITSLDGTISYRALFSRIEDVMREKAPKQRPVLEGDGIDRELFGGRYLRQLPYFTVNVAQSNSKVIILNAGTVSGVTVGSVISFFPSGTTDPNNKESLRKGTVTAAGNFTAAVKLEKEDAQLLKKLPWAFVTEMAYGTNKIKLGLDSLPSNSANGIRESLKDFQLVEFNPKCELFVGKSESGTGWALRYANSGTVFSDDLDISNQAALKEALKKYDRFRYLQNLKFAETGLSAKVELVFLDEKGSVDKTKMATRMKFGRLELQEGDEVFLKITNTGNKRFYINIVDIQPDGKINPVIPNKNLSDVNNNPAPIRWEDCVVNRYDSLFFKNLSIKISPPYGQETFKVFLSSDPLDLEDILTGNDDKASRSRGVLNNLAKIFEDSQVNAMGKRGAEGKINTAQDGTIFSMNFTIVENK